MTDFERYLEEARIQSEAEEAVKTEAFVNLLDRERAAQIRQRIEDPLLMWNEVSRFKNERLFDVEKNHKIPSAKKRTSNKPMDDAWWRGYGTGTIITALLALSALFVWWLI